jgi:hypothetical protein
VSLPDTIEFLRQNGLDKLVDGYGVHVYPTGDPHATVSARMRELEKKNIFYERSRNKPCWLTEWGILNGQSCPIDVELSDDQEHECPEEATSASF